jgi:dTDP-4-dehydrorhamnose 3,5-epimerase
MSLAGCYEIQLRNLVDERGFFRKTFQRSIFEEYGLDSAFQETFYTSSTQNVLRGMHVQLPPAHHAKLLYCLSGRVMDVLLDLRTGSPEFGRCAVLELDAARATAVYVAPGVAHGYYVREGPAFMVYHVTSEHSESLDQGVHWSSVPVEWPTKSPLVSLRDSRLPSLVEFVSPFSFETAQLSDAG